MLSGSLTEQQKVEISEIPKTLTPTIQSEILNHSVAKDRQFSLKVMVQRVAAIAPAPCLKGKKQRCPETLGN